jgi:hypothetical protein
MQKLQKLKNDARLFLGLVIILCLFSIALQDGVFVAISHDLLWLYLPNMSILAKRLKACPHARLLVPHTGPSLTTGPEFEVRINRKP